MKLLIKRQDSLEKWIVASSSELLASPRHQSQQESLTYFWSGNPHPTGKDPLHASGVIGKSSIKGKNRITSFHAYPDGLIRFSDKALGEIKVQGPSTPAGSSGSGTKEWAHAKACSQNVVGVCVIDDRCYSRVRYDWRWSEWQRQRQQHKSVVACGLESKLRLEVEQTQSPICNAGNISRNIWCLTFAVHSVCTLHSISSSPARTCRFATLGAPLCPKLCLKLCLKLLQQLLGASQLAPG